MRILVVDDTETMRTLLASFLGSLGHEVVALAGGREVPAALADGPFDLVLTDVAMPDASGWEVLAQVRAARPDLPVVVMTGWNDGQAGPGAPAPDAVLEKPFGLDRVRAVLDAFARR